jgi:hypothetical protein
MNTFDIALGRNCKKIIPVQVYPINDLLEKYLPRISGGGALRHIDFISIDVEGFELRILKALDFEKYAPDYFLIEDLDTRNQDIMEYRTSEIYLLLKEKGYALVAKTLWTNIFKKMAVT